MRKQLKRGLFISFEGGEGLGKTTQIALLSEYLRREGHYAHVIETREPGGSSVGKDIRNILLQRKEPLTDAAELLLLFADRAQHVAELIRPALEEGQIVLCDRYIDSSLVYQGWGRGMNFETIWGLHELATGMLLPDLTFVMEGKPHRSRGTDRFEQLGDAFHDKVRRGYWHLVHNELFNVRFAQKARYRAIAAEREREVIAAEILGIVEPFLSERL